MLMLIAEKLASRFNFMSYTYRDEMIGDGILRAVESLKSFDTTRPNPFGYFTLIIYRTFVQRIKKEKQERDTRDKLIMVEEIFSMQDGDTSQLTKDQVIGDFVFNSGNN